LDVAGRPDQAAKDYAVAGQLAAGFMDPADRVELIAESGDGSATRRLALQVIRDRTDDEFSVNNVCWALAMAPGGDPSRAAQAMAPIAETTDEPALIDTYAWCLYQSGQQRQALGQEQRALLIALRTGAPHTGYYTACVDGMSGNAVEASVRLRSIFAGDIMFTSAWDAADCLAAGSAPRAGQPMRTVQLRQRI
jgi:hypothetical protein